jgi:curved DNA-binding protein
VAYKDYYSVLGIQRSASADEIQQAYRKLARKYHPDVSKEQDAEARFKELGEAYDVLKDEQKRKLYDQYGEQWKAASEGRAPPPDAGRANVDFEGFRGDDFNPEEFSDVGSLFESFFGGGGYQGGARGAGRRRWAAGGRDREATLELSVEEAFHGGERTLTLLDGESGEQKRYTVKIPPAVRSGQRIRLAGEGHAGSGGAPAGDLYLQVLLHGSERFRLEGDDVYTTLPVAPWEAGLGATVGLTTLEGEVRVKVPAGSSTGRKIRLRGKGYGKSDGPRGDLYAELRIEMPPTLSDEERQLLERWSQTSSFSPRAEAGR